MTIVTPHSDRFTMRPQFLFPLLAVLLLPVLPAGADDQKAEAEKYELFRKQGARLMSDYSLEQPFQAAELRALAEKDTRDFQEARRMMGLILHAAVRKDARFQDLLAKPGLRTADNVDLALSAYDYALNGSREALDRVLAQLATEDIGADVDTIVVLSVLDEWDRTIRAYRKHFIHTDGAGGSCMVGFRQTRAYLYPQKYLAMREAIEAVIVWPGPLLPEE